MNKLRKMEIDFPKTSVSKITPQKNSIVGGDMQIEGNIHSSASVIIEGSVVGDISAKTVTIAKNAVHTGNIFADNVLISGKVTGEIITHNLDITSSASIAGKIQKTSISIEFGAKIDAHIRSN
ncbi:MAG: polymer-forming cytoskeletal protein [Hyphomicrobiales bacterium]